MKQEVVSATGTSGAAGGGGDRMTTTWITTSEATFWYVVALVCGFWLGTRAQKWWWS